MKKSSLLIGVFTLLIFASCKIRMYTPANYGALKNHTEKPTYINENVAKNYVSLNANYGEYDDDDYFTGDPPPTSDNHVIYGIKQSLTFDAYRSHATKNFNFYYGLGYTYGRYNFKSPVTLIKEKDVTKDTLSIVPKDKIANFNSVNAKVGGNIRLESGGFEIRVIGLELVYAHEFGNYTKILNQIPSNLSDDIYTIKKNPLLGYNFYSEYTCKINADHKATFGLYLGGFANINGSESSNIKTNYEGMNLAYTYKKNTLYIVNESANVSISSMRIGFVRQL